MRLMSLRRALGPDSRGCGLSSGSPLCNFRQVLSPCKPLLPHLSMGCNQAILMERL